MDSNIEPIRSRLTLTVPLWRVALLTLPVAIYSLLALLKKWAPFSEIPNIPLGIEAALSFAMALLLAFRVNRAYERWWEARTLWGTQVNVSRNLAVKIRRLGNLTPADRREARDLIVAFSHALRSHLRNEPHRPFPDQWKRDPEAQHIPSFLVSLLYQRFNRWHQENRISDAELWILDRESRVFLDVCGACERIKNTLMSESWRALSAQCIVLYLLVLPWGLVEDFGLWMVPLVIVTAYLVISSESIASYVERPFGNTEDHLDLNSICRAIEDSVNEIFDERM